MTVTKVDHSKGGNTPCPICHRPEGDHSESEVEVCVLEIGCVSAREQVSNALLETQAITKQTLRENWWQADPSKVLPIAEQLRPNSPHPWKNQYIAAYLPWKNRHVSAYLWGTFGTGKTYVARCILNETMKAGLRVVDVDAIALARQFRQFKLGHIVELAKYCSVLLIDDIDKAIWDERAIEGLWELIHVRADRRVKTVITSNVHPKEFADMIAAGCGGNQTRAQSLWQRLMPCLVLEFEGKSLRAAQREEERNG